VLEIGDLILDWDFYVEVKNSDQESIIRAVDVKHAILGFAIFGTIMFFATLITLIARVCMKMKGGNISETLKQRAKNVYAALAFFCVWLEDLPQIVLAVVVAVKSTELISGIQLVKAWYALAEAAMESTMTTVELRPCCDNKPEGWKRVLLIFELIANILILIVSGFLLIELYFDNFKETFPLQNNSTIFNTNTTTTTTWSTPISST
jgi:hypothetical protein